MAIERRGDVAETRVVLERPQPCEEALERRIDRERDREADRRGGDAAQRVIERLREEQHGGDRVDPAIAGTGDSAREAAQAPAPRMLDAAADDPRFAAIERSEDSGAVFGNDVND